MLDIESVVLDWVVSVQSMVVSIRRHDRALSEQLSRSSKAVALNLSEGSGTMGGNKQRAFRVALGEMRESMTAIEIASRLGFVREPGESEIARTRRIVGTLVNLAHPGR